MERIRDERIQSQYLCDRAMARTVTGLRREVARSQGHFDSKNRWTFTDSRVGDGNYCRVCDTYLRSPSAAYPYSVLKHAYSRRHALRCIDAGVATPADCETEERSPAPRSTTVYKIVRVLPDGRWVSCYDGETEYRLEETLQETAQPDHGGGLYGYEGTPSEDGTDVVIRRQDKYGIPYTTSLRRQFVRTKQVIPEQCCVPGTYALIECRGEGRKLRYSGAPGCAHGKLAFSRLTPLRLLATFEVEHFLTCQPCLSCGGHGWKSDTDEGETCRRCYGSGNVWA